MRHPTELSDILESQKMNMNYWYKQVMALTTCDLFASAGSSNFII